MLLIFINALRFGAAVEQPTKQTKLFLRGVPYRSALPGAVLRWGNFQKP